MLRIRALIFPRGQEVTLNGDFFLLECLIANNYQILSVKGV